MAEKVAFEIVLPDRLLMSADVEAVVVPGREGDFTVLAGHAPVITTLRPNVIEVFEEQSGTPTRIFVRGGFADLAADRLTVLAEEAIMLADLDRADLEQRIRDASEDVEDAKTDEDRENAHAVHDQLSQLLQSLG